MNSDPHSKFCKFLVSVMSGTSDFVFVDKLIFFFFDKNILEEKNYTVNLTYLAFFFFFFGAKLLPNFLYPNIEKQKTLVMAH